MGRLYWINLKDRVTEVTYLSEKCIFVPIRSGFLTKRGFLQASIAKGLKRIKVGDVMKQPVIRVSMSTPIKEALEVCQEMPGSARECGHSLGK